MADKEDSQEVGGEEAPRYCLEPEKVWRIEVPLHITGFWLPIWRQDPISSGSLGAGLLLEPGVLVVAETGPECPPALTVMGHAPGLPPVALRAMGGARSWPGVTVRVVVPVPLGSGYAVSGALALGMAVLVSLLEGRSLESAAREAHVAEVVEGTGLGDVVAIYYGRMLEARTSPGGPGVGRVESFPVDARHVVTVSLGAYNTSAMHAERLAKIQSSFPKAYTGFLENPSLDSFLERARSFSIEVGFVDREMAEELDRLVSKNYARGWYAKKKVVVIIPEEGYEGEVVEAASRLPGQVFVHRVSGTPLVVSRAA